MSRRNTSLVAAVTGVLLVAAFGAAVAGPWEMEERNLTLLTDLFEPRTFPTIAVDTPEFDLAPGSSPGLRPDLSWMRYVAIGLATAIGIAFSIWLVRRYQMTRAPEPVAVQRMDGMAGSAEAAEVPALQEGVRAARRVLDGGTEPDDAIISAWLMLEEAAAGAGVRRRPSQTPTEFALTVLERTAADSAATKRLLGLYRRARFSRDPSTPDDVAEALRCLDLLANSWDTVAARSEQ